MNLLSRYEEKHGMTVLASPAQSPLNLISFGVLRLRPGDVFEFRGTMGDEPDMTPEEAEALAHVISEQKEQLVVLLSGKCNITCGDKEWNDLSRRSVFAERATAAYIAAGDTFSIKAIEPTELAIGAAPSELETESILIEPEDVKAKSVGAGNWRRDVYDILDVSYASQHLVIGETMNPPGNWSSFPPHRHDFDNPPEEVDMEEVYFFKVDPPKGFGMQRVYTDDRSLNQAFLLENNSFVVIPRGYHPVAAAPGYRLYYLWVLAGKNRILRPKDDPDHTWVQAIQPLLKERI